PLTTNEESLITFRITAAGTNANSVLHFNLGEAPPQGAAINPTTGEFSWTPSEAQGPGSYIIPVNCVDSGNVDQNACIFLTINVNETNKPPQTTPIPDQTVEYCRSLVLQIVASDPDIPANALSYSLLSPVPAGASIGQDTGRFSWSPHIAQI